MNRVQHLRTCLTTFLVLAAACGERGSDAGPSEDASASAPAVPDDTVITSDTSAELQPAVRVYPTLTDHEWYARGEPLRHEGVPYTPSGPPVAAPAADMQRVGEYQGVDYYVRAAQQEPVVYVPVYSGYWQPFSAEVSPQPRSD